MTVTVILRTNKQPNKRGQYPLALQIIRDRKTSLVHIGEMILPEEWDGTQVTKNHPNSVRLNNKIRKKLNEATDKSLEHDDASAKTLKQKIKPTGKATFFGQAKLYLDNIKKAKKYNRYSADKPRIKYFQEYAGDISFKTITKTYLETFKADLIDKRDVTERTALNYIVVIRSIFSQAIDDKIIDKNVYPFGKNGFKIKFPESSKIGLNKKEVEKLETIELPEYENRARDIWLTSYYFAGMRISDVLSLRWSDMPDGRLHYVMGKNSKAGSLKIPDKAQKIFDRYRESNPAHNLVFPDLKGLPNLDDKFEIQKRIKTRVHETNERLALIATKADITKKLTNHIARHSFGNIAGDTVPIPVLQKLFRHSSITVTVEYMKHFTNKHTDDALDLVLGS